MLEQRSPFQLTMLGVALFLGFILLSVLGVRTFTEVGGSNSYALIAESFLTATPWVSGCFDGDCALHEGRTYIVFPPVPGLIAVPLVALNGIMTTGFMVLGLIGALLSLYLWKRIFSAMKVDGDVQLWLLLALAFASPLFYVTLRADGVWFFAQVVGFPLLTLALHEAYYGRFITSGMALGAALLCRQMSVFYAPLLLLIAIGPSAPLLRMDWDDVRQRFGWFLKLAIPIAIGLAGYFAYNIWRFDDPLNTGYAYIFSDIADDAASGIYGELDARVIDHGIWSSAYVIYNAAYLLVQGFHITFDPIAKLTMTGMDNGGTGVLAASPWLLFLAFTPWRRMALLCLALIVGFSTLLLFYHSNGFSQYNTQRYILDWLPAALLMLAMAKDRLAAHRDVLALLVLWGMALNVVTVVVLALTS